MSATDRDPDETFPQVPLQLLEELERRFPDRCPEIDTPDRSVWVAVGSTRVVRFLRQMFTLQNENH